MNKLDCGCTPDASGFGYCDKCVKALHIKIWKKMSPGKRAYDRTFDPIRSAKLDRYCGIDVDNHSVETENCGTEPEGCSCHINPPCSFCVNMEEDEQ